MKKPNLFYVKPVKSLNFDLETEPQVSEHRKVRCIFYSNCLNYAAYMCWQSFSCKGCIHYFEDKDFGEIDDLKACEFLLSIIRVPIKKEKNK